MKNKPILLSETDLSDVAKQWLSSLDIVEALGGIEVLKRASEMENSIPLTQEDIASSIKVLEALLESKQVDITSTQHELPPSGIPVGIFEQTPVKGHDQKDKEDE